MKSMAYGAILLSTGPSDLSQEGRTWMGRQVPEVGLYLEVGEEGIQHLGVLPVHLHVVEFAVESDRVEEALEGRHFEEEGVPAQTTSPNVYSTHSRWLKFLFMICRQVFPIWLRDRSTRVTRFMLSNDSTSSAHS